ncbi:nodulation protein NfeD [Virgibacillus sp. MSJ-26]|uniref:NfeD family protein n=1 Tax=Virgibacillus sp. MSJ-26 TaxID=2841522 RepID=UPI001C0FE210|nr:NfeD family protein [Virgibacillus sp. MSJ-26]MBU5466410.1 nodulation protein NfeD [Virgibacillus sp. MSJ-26]
MDIFSHDWIGFVITGFATLFLIGEILVNMRGIFALLGIGFITVYFSVFLATDSLLLMLIVYFVGLLLIIVDGKLVNDGTLATIGLASMIIAVALPAPNLTAGVYGVLGVIIGGAASLSFLKVFKRRKMWGKMTLKESLTSEAGYNSLSEEYGSLLGKDGITLTDFRPVGTVQIKNKTYSAVTNGQWISKDSAVKVIAVDGTKILVEKQNSN